MDKRITLTVCKVGGPMQRAPIEMWVGDAEVGVRMSLDSFLAALASEVGNPTMLLTQAMLEKQLRAAADRIVTHMKRETTGT